MDFDSVVVELTSYVFHHLNATARPGTIDPRLWTPDPGLPDETLHLRVPISGFIIETSGPGDPISHSLTYIPGQVNVILGLSVGIMRPSNPVPDLVIETSGSPIAILHFCDAI